MTAVKTENSQAKDWAQDGAVQGVATAANLLGGILVAWFATRNLLSDDFGVLAWATAAVTYLGFFGRFGGIQAATISLSQTDPAERHAKEWSFVAVTLLGSLAVGSVWIAAVALLDRWTSAVDDLGNVPLLVGLWLPLTALVPTIGGVLRGRGEFVRSALIAEWVRKLTVIAALILVVRSDSEVVDIERLVTLVIGLDAVIALVALVQLGAPGLPRWLDVKACARESVSFAVMSIGAASVPSAALVVVGFMIDTGELALLGVALRIFSFVAAGYAVLVRVATPRIARAHAEGSLLELGPVLRRFAFVAAVGQLMATVAFAIVGRWALETVFGEFYVEAFWVTLLLLVGGVTNTYFGPAMLTLTCTGDRWYVANARVISAICFTTAAAVSALAVGAIGVAACFVVTIGVFNLLMWRRAKTVVGLDTAARWERQPVRPGAK